MAGFVDFEITWRKDVFAGAPQEGSAANFGTKGINFRARKPVDEAEWHATLAELVCEIPQPEETLQAPMTQPMLNADAFHDAGDEGCGYGPITEIAKKMKQLATGKTLEVRATDPTVAVDLPAWCRLAGHEFVKHVDDRYLIKRV